MSSVRFTIIEHQKSKLFQLLILQRRKNVETFSSE